ncbi:MAG: sensor histidine kinase, partial [Alphaproteobacteria bacterium]
MTQTELSTGRTENRQLSVAGQYAAARQVRLRSLVWIRWIAVVGQLAALLIVQFGFGWNLPITAALAAVAASVILNVAMTFRRPLQGRLGELEAAAYLGFDILQLAVLLYLTGGLSNPFALLFLGPVTVSASILSRSATVVLSALVVICASLLAFYHQ